MIGPFLILAVSFVLFAGCRPKAPHDEPRRAAAGLGFTDVTHAAGLSRFRHENGAYGQRLFPETMSGGVAFIDSNQDGWQDILVVGGGVFRGDENVPAVRLFENTGGGAFHEVTAIRGLADARAYGMGLAVADYDNDGDDDFFLSAVFRDLLFRNDRSASGRLFTEVATEAGLANDSTWGSAAVFFDADRDGWVDLFVGNYVRWSPATDLWCMSGGEKSYCTPEMYVGAAPFFYRSNGDGTFSEHGRKAGFSPGEGKTLGAALLDYNADGWLDLAVANDTEPDELFRNEGDGTFTEVGVESGIAYDERGRARAGMGIDVGVVDDTGRPTVFVANFTNEMNGVYRYEGNGLFSDRAAVSRIGGLSRRSLSFGNFLFDAELDGDLDLFVANGHIIPEVDEIDDDVTYRQPPHLFLNDGSGVFRDAATDMDALANPLLGRGAACADVDLDGDLDVVVAENAGPVRLFRNETRIDSKGPAYLRVELQGSNSNRSAIGSKVTAFVRGERLVRMVRSGSSYQSQSELPLTFGLGDNLVVDSLVVDWPLGRRDVYRNIPVNQTLRLLESGMSTTLSAGRASTAR